MIAEALSAVSAGEIHKLLINEPPRHGKSTIISVIWPVWTWTLKPSASWLFSSYALGLSIRDLVKSRRLIESPWFQSLWGSVFQLAQDQNTKKRFDNNRSGYRLATSVDSAVTGEGADIVVVDDPHNVKKTSSDTIRAATLTWWDETMKSRLNNPRTGARVIVMQRIHDEDLSGHVLKEGDWEHVCLAEEFEPERPQSARFPDWRTSEGELLWPERIGPAEVAEFKTMGTYAYEAQYQQNAMPRGGGMFKRSWWRRWAELPKLTRVELFVDSAFKDGIGNDYTVFALWGTDGLGNYYLIALWRARVEYPEFMQAAHDVHAQHRHRARVVPLNIEDKASGQSAIQTLSRPMPTLSGKILPALPVIPFPVNAGESKVARAEGVTPLVEAGRVFLPLDAPWVEDFITEHEKFPAGAHDDQVDTTSMGLSRLAGKPEPSRRLVTYPGV